MRISSPHKIKWPLGEVTHMMFLLTYQLYKLSQWDLQRAQRGHFGPNSGLVGPQAVTNKPYEVKGHGMATVTPTKLDWLVAIETKPSSSRLSEDLHWYHDSWHTVTYPWSRPELVGVIVILHLKAPFFGWTSPLCLSWWNGLIFLEFCDCAVCSVHPPCFFPKQLCDISMAGAHQ